MNAALSPIESEFASTEEAEAYDRWFCAQVQEAIADPRPSIPHDHVMAEMRAIIAKKGEVSRNRRFFRQDHNASTGEQITKRKN